MMSSQGAMVFSGPSRMPMASTVTAGASCSLRATRDDAHLELTITNALPAAPLRSDHPTGFGNKCRDWRPVHHLVLEAAGREIPPGYALVFRDGDKRNAALDNLELITRADLMARNSVHRYPEHIVRAVQAVGALNRQINRRARAAQPEESTP